MQVASEIENPDELDPSEYIRAKEEFEDKRDEFMRKYLRRSWPVRIICILGVFQLLLSLAILGVDLPIILMFAPRWQVFAGCWGFVFEFIACVATLHTTRKMTWLKIKWAVALNILGGIAAAIMTAFDILYLVNSNFCLVASGCSYLSYTFSAVPPYYIGQTILGIFFLISVFIFLIIFIKYGIGGTTLFESIQQGSAPAIFDPIISPDGSTPPPPLQPAPGPGVMNRPPPGSGMMPGPYGPPMMPGPRGPMMVPRPGMMPGPYGPMMVPGPRPPMMPGPRGPMMIPGPPPPMMAPGPRPPMMVRVQRPPMQAFYRQPGPYPPSAQRYQN